jgi:hypothetical protein
VQPFSRRRICEHIPGAPSASKVVELLLEAVFSNRSVLGGFKEDNWVTSVNLLRGGGDKHLHRSPASHRRRRKGTQCLGV